MPGTLYYIRYAVDGGGSVTIATTRPETMLGDTAVAVHPDDERYKALIGKTAILPLLGRELPIVADERVDPEFGTGALKVTPAHDPNDFEIGRTHSSRPIQAIGQDGRITEAGGPYAGLEVEEAAERVVADLEAPARSRRSSTTRTASPPATAAARPSSRSSASSGSCAWTSSRSRPPTSCATARSSSCPSAGRASTSTGWRTCAWCITRQLWWGHQLPVWYCRTAR